MPVLVNQEKRDVPGRAASALVGITTSLPGTGESRPEVQAVPRTYLVDYIRSGNPM